MGDQNILSFKVDSTILFCYDTIYLSHCGWLSLSSWRRHSSTLAIPKMMFLGYQVFIKSNAAFFALMLSAQLIFILKATVELRCVSVLR